MTTIQHELRSHAEAAGEGDPLKARDAMLAAAARIDYLEGRLALATRFSLNSDLMIVSRGDKWAISDAFGNVMRADGEWEWEPMPSSRTGDFINRTRFSLDDAFRIVGEKMPE